MHELVHEFTSRKVSPWGGLKYFYGTYQKSGIREQMSRLPLPRPGSNRGYQPEDLIEAFMCSVVMGSRRLAHTGMLRSDAVVKEIFGWKRGMADQSTFSRFFRKHTMELNDRIFPALMRGFFEQIKIDGMTIDVDSTVITRYGNQELAEVGYNPTKRGRASHHPILAFCDELAMVVNAWMRSGDSVSTTDANEFLQEMFTIVAPSRIGLMRFDSGFFSQKIMKLLEAQDKPIPYIIRGKMTPGIAQLIQQQTAWYANNDVMQGAEYCTTTYQASTWDQPRKIVNVFVTSVTFSASVVHSLYNKRANAENRIKDLKCDDGLQSDGDLQTVGHAYRKRQDAVNHTVPMHCNRKLPGQAWFTKGHEAVSRRPTMTLFGAFLREFGDPSSAIQIF
jgi:Transposase DDE domain group 1